MRLQVEHDLQPVLDLAEKRVVLLQDRPLQVCQAANAIELRERFQRIAGTQLGQIAAVEQLEKLDDELDVADAAAAGFHVAGKSGDWLRAPMRERWDQRGRRGVCPRCFRRPAAERKLLDPPFQGLNAADVGVAQIAAVDPRPERFQKLVAQREIAGHGPGLDVGLPLPGATAGVVIAHGALDAHDHRPPLPLRPQSHVDAVDAAQFGLFGQQPNDFTGHQIEELAVRDGPRAVGLAVARGRGRSSRCRWSSSTPGRRACPSPRRRTGRAGRRGRAACPAAARTFATPPARPTPESRRPGRRFAP